MLADRWEKYLSYNSKFLQYNEHTLRVSIQYFAFLIFSSNIIYLLINYIKNFI